MHFSFGIFSRPITSTLKPTKDQHAKSTLENVFRKAKQKAFGDIIKKIPNIRHRVKITVIKMNIKRNEYIQSIIPKTIIILHNPKKLI